MTAGAPFRCGTVAIVGRPNVGKSTLLNALVGEKVSITSRKPQTTWHRICGILTKPDVQYVFVDTPGMQARRSGSLSRMLNRTARDAVSGVDVVMLVVQAGVLSDADRAVLAMLPRERPVFLVVNKSDLLPHPEEMLPFLEQASKAFAFAEVVPVSATKRRNLDELLAALPRYFAEQPPLFEPEAITDRSERFLAAELLREKVIRQLGDELPYATTVVIDRFQEESGLRRIHAAIVVDKENHKPIVIGKDGGRLKAIARAARIDMEKLFGGKVFLEVWVKVRSGWTEDPDALRRLGLTS